MLLPVLGRMGWVCINGTRNSRLEKRCAHEWSRYMRRAKWKRCWFYSTWPSWRLAWLRYEIARSVARLQKQTWSSVTRNTLLACCRSCSSPRSGSAVTMIGRTSGSARNSPPPGDVLRVASEPYWGGMFSKEAEKEMLWLTQPQIHEVLTACESYEKIYLTRIVKVCLATVTRWSEVELLTYSQLSPHKLTFTKTKGKRIARFRTLTGSTMNWPFCKKKCTTPVIRSSKKCLCWPIYS